MNGSPDVREAIEESLHSELMACAAEHPELRQALIDVMIVPLPAPPSHELPHCLVSVIYGDNPPIKSSTQRVDGLTLHEWLDCDLASVDVGVLVRSSMFNTTTAMPEGYRLQNHLRTSTEGRRRCLALVQRAASCRLLPDHAAEFECTIDPPAGPRPAE